MLNSPILRRIVVLTGGVSVLLGVFVLLGWFTNNSSIVQIHSSFAPMQFNTALCFILCGLDLLFTHFNKKKWSVILAVIIAIIGGLTLVEYFFNVNIYIDELFMKHDITVATSHPGRMAPNTALCFVLCAVAYYFLNIKTLKNGQRSGILGTLVFGLGLTAFIGYIINLEIAYGWGVLTRMAVHTAFCFGVVGVGITSQSLLQEIRLLNIKTLYSPSWLFGYAFVLAITGFCIDLNLPSEASAGILYVLVLFFSLLINKKNFVFLFASVTTVLIVLAAVLTFKPTVDNLTVVVINKSLTILVIWVVSLLLKRIKKDTLRLNTVNLKLENNNHLLKTNNKELEQFAYVASHDLQEPLLGVNNFVNLFEREYNTSLDDTAKIYFKYIQEATYRMQNLVKGLLDYSLIGQEKTLTNVNTNEVIMAVSEKLADLIQETNTRLIFGNLPNVVAYEKELVRLFENLITNAIKYRKKDDIAIISVQAIKKEAVWEFSVTDNGIGISEKHYKYIFTIFKRLHLKNEYDGIGIGLSYCQKIVDLHRGKIWVTSKPNQGSVFYFTIPHNLNYSNEKIRLHFTN